MRPFHLPLFFLFTLIACSSSETEDSGRIYFLANRIGTSTNIFSIDAAGDVLKHTDSEYWRDFQFSMDRDENFYFVSNRKQERRADIRKMRDYFNVFTVSKGESSVRAITQSEATELYPKINDAGTHLAYVAIPEEKKAKTQVLLLALADKQEVVIAQADEILDIAWLRDNSGFSYATYDAGTAKLWHYDLASQQRQELLKKENNVAQLTGLAWSPDGKRLALIQHAIGKNLRELLIYERQATATKTVSAPEILVQNSPTWSPDGKQLLYSALVNFKFYYDETTRNKVYEGAMHIFVSDGEKSTQLTHSPGLHNHPVFSPDGSRIAFIYADTLDQQQTILKTMDLKGGNSKELYQPVAGESSLFWQ